MTNSQMDTLLDREHGDLKFKKFFSLNGTQINVRQKGWNLGLLGD